MKIVFQDYEYECGICVLTMIHNFLYNVKLKKQSIIKDILYSKNGMSIDDFETNSLILGFESTSYKIPFNDFFKTKLKDFFVTCINVDNRYHYVLCKIDNDNITIYDSAKGKYKISISDFENIFTEIIITFKKCEKYNHIFSNNNVLNRKLFFNNDYKFCFIFVGIEAIIFFTTLLSSVFVKVFINDIFPNKNIHSLIFSLLFFLILYLFNSLFEMLIKYFKYKKFKDIFQLNFYIYQNLMKNKSKIFFDKIDRKVIYQYLNFITLEIEKKYFLLPSSIFDIFSVILLVCLISFISPYFLFVIVIMVVFSSIIMMIKMHSNEKYYNDFELSNNKITNDLNNFYSFLANEKRFYKLKSLISNLQNEMKNNFNINAKKMFFDSISSSTLIFMDKFLFLLLSFVSSLIVFELNVDIHISSILFCFTLLNLLNNSINNLMELFSKIPIYKKSKVYLSDLEMLYNISLEEGGLKINNLQKISFKNIFFSFENCNNLVFKSLNINLINDTFICGKNGAGKSTLFRLLSLDYEFKEGDILFDDLSIKNLCKKNLQEKAILLTSDSTKSEIDFSSLLDLESEIKIKLINLMKKTNMNFGNLLDVNLSKGEIQIINFISLIEEKNKLILLDECLSNVGDEMIKYLFENFKDYIWKNNFVLFVSHNMKLAKYFNKIVRIRDENKI